MRYQIYEAKSVKYDAQQRVGVRGNGFGVIQKALVLQDFSASQTEKTAKMAE